MTTLTYFQFRQIADTLCLDMRLEVESDDLLNEITELDNAQPPNLNKWNAPDDLVHILEHVNSISCPIVGTRELKGNKYRPRHDATNLTTNTTNPKTPFKSTTAMTHISSAQKDINAIRIQLNKLSPAAPDLVERCLEQMKQVCTYYKDRVNAVAIYTDLAAEIYSSCILSTLFGEMYAAFYIQANACLPELDLYNRAMQKKQEYMDGFSAERDVPPEEYDAFCKLTKRNDLRKNTAAFFVHLYKKQFFTTDQILDLIETMLSAITRLANELTPPAISDIDIGEKKTEDKETEEKETEDKETEDKDEWHGHTGKPIYGKTVPTRGYSSLFELELRIDNFSILVMNAQMKLSREAEEKWWEQIIPSMYKVGESLTAEKSNSRIAFAWKRLIEIVEA